MLYKNSSEYLSDLLQIIRSLLDHYIQTTVEFMDGTMVRVVGMSYFHKDLLELTQEDYSDAKRKYYEQEMQETWLEFRMIQKTARESSQAGTYIPLLHLFELFWLNEFEQFCVLLSLAVELDVRFERIYAHLQDDYAKKYPSFDLCLRMFTFDNILRKSILIEENRRSEIFSTLFQKSTDTQLQSGISEMLKLKKRVVDFIFENLRENENLALYSYVITPKDCENTRLIVQSKIGEMLLNHVKNETKERCIYYLFGNTGSGRLHQIKYFSQKEKENILVVDLKQLPEEQTQFERLISEILLEARLFEMKLCFLNSECMIKKDGVFNQEFQWVMNQIWKCNSYVFLIGDQEWKQENKMQTSYKVIHIEVGQLEEEDRILLWRELLKDIPIDASVNPESMAAKFRFMPGAIRNSIKSAKESMIWDQAKLIDSERLHQACYRQTDHHLEDKATRINAVFSWEQLVLPEKQKALLKQAYHQVYYNHVVYEKWGFEKTMAYGRGLSLLFYGPPGTGKTMGAQVMAHELKMELYKVDLSTVISKYIGETQKNLSMIFDEVKKSNSILFFDEADSLFAKRSEVKDSHDRNANTETSYLLQRMEAYDGIVILASNYIQNIDEAFKRRLKYIIQFPFPDATQRLQLWKSIYPRETPVSKDIDYEFLANQFELTGSSIKNIALSAAFMAASQDKAVDMQCIIVSLSNEMSKYGKKIGKDECQEYYYLLEE